MNKLLRYLNGRNSSALTTINSKMKTAEGFLSFSPVKMETKNNFEFRNYQ